MMIYAVSDNAARLSVLAMDIGSQDNTVETGQRITELATKLLPDVVADLIRVTPAGTVRICSSSDQEASLQAAKLWQQWPHQVADPTLYRSPDDARQDREYAAALLAQCGVVAELICDLRVGSAHHGYLRLLLGRSAPTPEERELVAAFAAHAALALDRAALSVQVLTMAAAIESNRTIGTAIGILMAGYHFPYEGALEHLKECSQQQNRKLRQIAEEVVDTGALPLPRVTPPG